MAGKLRLEGNGGYYSGFESNIGLTEDLIWKLPAEDGSNEQALTTDGAKGLAWKKVPMYEEGTWTPSTDTVVNLTAPSGYGGARYRKIGDKVIATLDAIGGLSIITAGLFTYIKINLTGLPPTTDSHRFGYVSFCRINSSPYEVLPTALSLTSDTLFINIGSATGLGVVNGDAISVLGLHFEYYVV